MCYRLKIVRWGIAAVLSCVLGPPPALAAPSPKAHLLFVREAGAERCPDEAGVREVVARRLGYDPFAERASTTISVVFATAAPTGLRVRIELFNALGETTATRELRARSPDCRSLAQAAELAISMAIDPLIFVDEFANEKPALPPRAPDVAGLPPVPHVVQVEEIFDAPKVVEAVAAPKPPVVRPDPDRLRFRGGLGAAVALSAVASVTPGFTLQAGVRGPRWSAAIELRADLPTKEPAAMGGASTGLYTASLVPCFHKAVFAACVMASFGTRVSVADGPTYSTTAFVGVGFRAGLEIPLPHRLELHIAADVLASIVDQFQPSRTEPISGLFHIAMLGYFAD
jgi:hypothetical protein